MTRSRYTSPDFAVIFYDIDRPDKDVWLEAEKARILEQDKEGRIKTLFILPEQEEDEDKAYYAAAREQQ